MNNITYAVSVDVNNPIIPYNVYVASVLDSNVRYLEITLYENGNIITLSNTATATASLVTDNVLVNDSVNCTIQDNIITVPLEGLQRHGNLDVQVTVTEDTKVLAIPFPIQVRVTPNIAENAQIDEDSSGSYAEVVHEIAEARGSYGKLKDRLDHTTTALALKANAADVYTKAEADGALSSKVDTSTFNYQLGNVIAALNTKADAEEVYKKSEVYSKSEVNEAVNNKTIDNAHIKNGAVTEGKLSADVRNKLNGITPGEDIDLSDYYTKDEVDSALLDKSDKSSVYTKAEIDSKIGSGSIVSVINDRSQTGDDVNFPSVNAVRNYAKMYIDDLGNVIEGEINEVAGNIPTKTSDLTNDSGFLTAHQDISGKADKADTYTKSEVDSKIGSGSIVSVISDRSQTGDDVNYPSVNAARNYAKMVIDGWGDAMEEEINDIAADIPTKTSDLTNDSGFLTQHQDISGKENTSNKVTSISSSSTNTEYPSALAVKNYVEHYGVEHYGVEHYGVEDYWNSLPPTIYTRVNGETKIYFRNIFTPNYLMYWGQYTNSTTIQNYDDYASLAGTAAATKNVTFKTFDRGYRQIESGSTSVVINSTPPSSQKILIMGDSFVDGGTLTSLMRALFTADGNTLTAIGTKGTSPNYHEGYSGWKYIDFMNASKGAAANPFWNRNANAFDFSYYMNHNSFSGLNSVYIQLGTNDASASSLQTDFSAVVQAAQTIINSILSDDSNIKVYLGLTVMPTLDSTKFALKYNGIGVPWILRLNMQRLNAALIAVFSKNSSVKIVATNCVLDSSTDISDNVHPNSAGIKKIAQQVYYTMMS